MSYSEKYFDKESALQRIRNNEKLLLMMLKMFLDSEEPQKLSLALAANDYAEAANLSHAIKGVAGNLSLLALYEVATDFNQELKQGTYNSETAESFWRIFEATCDTVKAIFNQ